MGAYFTLCRENPTKRKKEGPHGVSPLPRRWRSIPRGKKGGEEERETAPSLSRLTVLSMKPGSVIFDGDTQPKKKKEKKNRIRPTVVETNSYY